MMIDQKSLRAQEAVCTADDYPGCMAACPVHVDGRAFCDAVMKGNFDEARSIYEKTVLFPGIVSSLCEEPCKKGCKRNELEASINMQLLEQAVMTLGKEKKKRRFLPKQKGTVAIAGGGLTALCLCLELRNKGYYCHLYFSDDKPGGRLNHIDEDRISKEVIEKDFQKLTQEGIYLHSGVSVTMKMVMEELVRNYDSVFIGCKLEGEEMDFEINNETFETNLPKVFAALPILSFSPVTAHNYGKVAAISMDRFIQNVSITEGRGKEFPFETSLFTFTDKIPLEEEISPENGVFYTEEEAKREAARCIVCQCLECVKECPYMDHYDIMPKKLAREVYNNMSIVMGIHHANQKINSCALCRQCEIICPNGFQVADICQMARNKMVDNGKMPPSTFSFPLEDMAFSNSDSYFFVHHQKGFDSSSWLYFPGCQLGGAAPELVKKSYEKLCLQQEGGVGLMLACCGAIAKWSGEEALYKETMKMVSDHWEAMGRPTVITACPTCYENFREELPHMETRFYWDLVEAEHEKSDKEERLSKAIVIHDACTTRLNQDLQDNVRTLLTQMGYEIEEKEHHGELTLCCGYGGLVQFSNPEVSEKFVDFCTRERDLPIVTYCINCREQFMRKGKPAKYLMELYFDRELPENAAGISEKRYRRVQLKNDLITDVFQESDRKANPYEHQLIFEDEIVSLLEKRLILTSDIQKTIDHAEETGDKLLDTHTGATIAYLRTGFVTFWVWYKKEDDKFRVLKAYSHRMEVEVTDNGN